MQELKRAVFLDRDGTLIEDRGYLRSPVEACFFERTIPALKRLQASFELFIVTNQSGVSKGLQTAQEVEAVNGFIEDRLKNQGIRIRAVYSCLHQREDGCSCIKPHPYFAQQAADRFGIVLEESFAIGDHPHDVEFGRRFGGTGLYVLTGHGEKHMDELPRGERIFIDLDEASRWLVPSSLCEEGS